MSGRAGRAGIDSSGESILIAGGHFPAAKLVGLLRDDPAPIVSCLTEDKRGMKRAMLEVRPTQGTGSQGNRGLLEIMFEDQCLHGRAPNMGLNLSCVHLLTLWLHQHLAAGCGQWGCEQPRRRAAIRQGLFLMPCWVQSQAWVCSAHPSRHLE